MKKLGLRFEPVDSLFMRDGTPFDAGGAVLSGVGGVFPPSPRTVAGAVRVALAKALRWNGRDRWSKELTRYLGDGPDDLGPLEIWAPLLLQKGLPLFPWPRHLLGEPVRASSGLGVEWVPRSLMAPGQAMESDIGRRRFSDSTKDSKKEWDVPEDAWLTRTGFQQVLGGRLPEVSEVRMERDLWRSEPRIGIRIDQETNAAEEGMLYSVRHSRPRHEVSLGVIVENVPPNCDPTQRFVPMGGEHRFVYVESWEAGDLLAKNEPEDGDDFLCVALSPIVLEAEQVRGDAPIPDFGVICCAYLDKPERIGGWDSLERSPLPVSSMLPTGSVLCFEGAMSPGSTLRKMGEQTALGFGTVALGSWPRQRGGP